MIYQIRSSCYKSQAFIQSYCAVLTSQGNRLHFLIKIISMPRLTLFSANVLLKIFRAIIRHYIKTFKLTYLISSWTQSSALHTDWFVLRKNNAQLWNCIFAGKKFQFLTEILKNQAESYRLSIFLKKLKCNFKIIRTFVSSIATEVFYSQVTIKFDQVFLR